MTYVELSLAEKCAYAKHVNLTGWPCLAVDRDSVEIRRKSLIATVFQTRVVIVARVIALFEVGEVHETDF